MQVKPKTWCFILAETRVLRWFKLGCISKSGSIKVGRTEPVVLGTNRRKANNISEHFKPNFRSVRTRSDWYDMMGLILTCYMFGYKKSRARPIRMYILRMLASSYRYPQQSLENSACSVAQHVRDSPPNDATILKRFCHAIGVVKSHMGACSKYIIDRPKRLKCIETKNIKDLAATCSFHDCHCHYFLTICVRNKKPNNQLDSHANQTTSQETCRFIHLNVRVVWFFWNHCLRPKAYASQLMPNPVRTTKQSINMQHLQYLAKHILLAFCVWLFVITALVLGWRKPLLDTFGMRISKLSNLSVKFTSLKQRVHTEGFWR